MAELKGEYIYDFYDVKEYVEKHAKTCPERNEAIETLHSIYLDAQENDTPLSEIHENSAKEYAKEIVEGLPHMAPEKKKIIKRIVIAVLAVAFILTAFFTSDVWNLYVGGFNYRMKFFERTNGYGLYYTDEDFIVNLTDENWRDPESYSNLSELGIYFDKVTFEKDAYFDIFMTSKTIQTSLTSYMHFKPCMTYGTAQYYRNFKFHEPVTAEINGVTYIGKLMTCDATGRDLKYWIFFEPEDENADCTGCREAFKNGEELKITFGEIDMEHWSYPGLKQMIIEGRLPFFVPYRLENDE